MNLGLTTVDFLIIIVCCVIWFLISLYEERHMRENGGDGTTAFREMLDRKSLLVRWIILLVGFAFVLALGIYGPGYDAAAFIYRGF